MILNSKPKSHTGIAVLKRCVTVGMVLIAYVLKRAGFIERFADTSVREC